VPSIFISYRREDTSAVAGRLGDELTSRFGRSSVFIDIDSIPPGADFERRITNALDLCDVAFVLIGDRWLTATLPDGTRRLDHEGDPLRKEIAAALTRDDLAVVPVLVEGTELPSSADLPADIASLTKRNAAELSNKRWRFDVTQLVAIAREHDSAVSRLLRALRRRAPYGVPVVLLGAVAVAVIALATGGPGVVSVAPTAQISEAYAYPNVPLQNYLDSAPGKLVSFRRRAEALGLTAVELKPVLQGKGVIATFTLELKGPVGTAFDVKRTLLEASTNARVPEAGTTVVPPPRYILRNRDERFVDDTWIANPHAGRGAYVVELDVLDAHGTVLAYRQTSSFRIGG